MMALGLLWAVGFRTESKLSKLHGSRGMERVHLEGSKEKRLVLPCAGENTSKTRRRARMSACKVSKDESMSEAYISWWKCYRRGTL